MHQQAGAPGHARYVWMARSCRIRPLQDAENMRFAWRDGPSGNQARLVGLVAVIERGYVGIPTRIGDQPGGGPECTLEATSSNTPARTAGREVATATGKSLCYYGQGGIRTHGTLAGTPVFETGRFNHSRTCPTSSHPLIALRAVPPDPAPPKGAGDLQRDKSASQARAI